MFVDLTVSELFGGKSKKLQKQSFQTQQSQMCCQEKGFVTYWKCNFFSLCLRKVKPNSVSILHLFRKVLGDRPYPCSTHKHPFVRFRFDTAHGRFLLLFLSACLRTRHTWQCGSLTRWNHPAQKLFPSSLPSLPSSSTWCSTLFPLPVALGVPPGAAWLSPALYPSLCL